VIGCEVSFLTPYLGWWGCVVFRTPADY